MKDKQVESAATQAAIPIISPVLHCVAMTVIVYLRSGFGYAYLRPKSLFVALAWTTILFSFIIWNEPSLRSQYWPVSLFALGATLLYLGNLIFAFRRELHKAGTHDYYSGESRLMIGRLGFSELTEINLHLWAEPALVIAISAFLRIALNESRLSIWLFFAAICLWLKEAFNYWHELRRKKHHQDIFEDAAESTEMPQAQTTNSAPPKATRTAKAKRQRNSGLSAEEQLKEQRYAEILRLMPPHTLEQAEQNFRQLIKTNHPDANEGSEESNAHAVQLNEAISYFRQKCKSY